MKIKKKEIKINFIQKCDEDCDVDIIMPSFNDRKMSIFAAKSFFKFEKNLKIKVIFIDPYDNKDKFDIGKGSLVTAVSVSNEKFFASFSSGEMSHSNAYALEVGRRLCTAPYIFVCHNDVLAYRKNWLSFLRSKMDRYRQAAFIKDNTRVCAAHVSGFMYDRKFFDNVGVEFWPRDKPERDVGDDFSYYLQRKKKPFFVCRCSHNDASLLKNIHKRYPELKKITADKCLDDEGNVIYMHTGRGTVKMLGHYTKKNRTTYKEWLKFSESVV